jgi:acetyltransferase-like isoleucine patch superfamily enzyme
MPIRVYGPLKLTLKGKIILPSKVSKNMIVIGSDHEDYTASSGKAELNIQGTWKLSGFLRIGPDSCIVVDKGALLEVDSDTYLGRDTQIHCYHHVSIGNGVFAGEMYVCDSAIHQIVSAGKEKPLHGDVVIGDGVYLGFRTILLKGTVIPAGSVVGSGAVCTSDFSKDGTEKLFICGNPAVVKAQDVTAKF